MTLRNMTMVAAMLAALPVQSAEIDPALWDRPRTAQTVLAQPALRQIAEAYFARDGVRIHIVHGARQEAQSQAGELRAWLIALGMDGSRLQLREDRAASGLRVETGE